ncbi:MAG TPA: hypothetical protein VD907_03815 [Verrucomicrobiae bacterium]|nr:hypothetical protein [Verrucomicrobiae bacterium]
MRVELPMCLFNFEAGGLQPSGQYDFGKLRLAFKNIRPRPVLIVINEGKEWGSKGSIPLFAANSALMAELGGTYEAHLGHSERGPFGPAIFFDPNVLEIKYWGDERVPYLDKRNLGRFVVRGNGQPFEVLAQHWNPDGGELRMTEAGRAASLGKKAVPELLMGDLNETASGLHLPQFNWEIATPGFRRGKGRQLPDGSWTAYTDNVDRLVGKWDPTYAWGHPKARRYDGEGFHIVAELAAKSGTPSKEAFMPTVNEGVDIGGELLIDYMLINAAWLKKGGLAPKTYKVHVPAGNNRRKWPSDHRLVSATFWLG